MKKRDYHIWLTPMIGDEIQRRAKAGNQSISVIIEQLLARVFTTEEAEAKERHALPLLRQVLGEDQAAALEEFRQAIRADVRADIAEITGKHTDRLAAIQVRVGRAASLTWRLLFRLCQKQYGNAIAEAWYSEARDMAAKSMATRLESGKEIEK